MSAKAEELMDEVLVLPEGDRREFARELLVKVAIDTDEGTWMNVDVSPDGTRIAFDMLGDVYVMPITGGTPTRIAGLLDVTVE